MHDDRFDALRETFYTPLPLDPDEDPIVPVDRLDLGWLIAGAKLHLDGAEPGFDSPLNMMVTRSIRMAIARNGPSTWVEPPDLPST